MPDEKGNPPLWLALANNLEDVASTLVRRGCDAMCWGPGPSGCLQALLHRAMDENNEPIACFLSFFFLNQFPWYCSISFFFFKD